MLRLRHRQFVFLGCRPEEDTKIDLMVPKFSLDGYRINAYCGQLVLSPIYFDFVDFRKMFDSPSLLPP